MLWFQYLLEQWATSPVRGMTNFSTIIWYNVLCFAAFFTAAYIYVKRRKLIDCNVKTCYPDRRLSINGNFRV